MDPYIKDLFEVATWCSAVVGGAIAAASAIHGMRAGTKQRFAELRWKRASAAKDLLQEIHGHDKASAAVLMMDWYEGTHGYEIDGVRVHVSLNEVLTTLTKPPADCLDGRDIYISDCFDWFFYFIDRLEHYIQTGFIDFEDVASVFTPYARKLALNKQPFLAFMDSRGYELALQFWARYGIRPHTDAGGTSAVRPAASGTT